jgi:hypothetical protein
VEARNKIEVLIDDVKAKDAKNQNDQQHCRSYLARVVSQRETWPVEIFHQNRLLLVHTQVLSKNVHLQLWY